LGPPAEAPSPSFLGRRLSTGHPRGLYLTAAGLAGSVGIASVVALACLMQPDGRGIDATVATELHEHARSNPELVAFGLAVTAVASASAIGAIAVAVGLVLARRRRFDLLACWLAGLAGAAVLREVLKQTIRRPRPAFPDPLVVESSTSFPSGHALGSVVCFGILAYFALLAAGSRRTGLAAVGAAAVLVLAVGLSRLYLGAHYPTDVLAGYAAGVGWLAVWLGGWEAVRRGRLARDGVVENAADGSEERA